MVMFGEEPRVAGTSGMGQRQPEVGRLCFWERPGRRPRPPSSRGDGGLDPGASERTE